MPARHRPRKAAEPLLGPTAFKPPGYREELCAFFRGTGTDVECRTLEQILTWDDQLMEVCHDYIQWLLPTDEKSKFNSDAPVLDAECQRAFRDDEIMRRNFRRGAQRFLTFLGLSANLDGGNGEPPSIVRASHFPKRLLMCWRGPANHNWKRVSRALRSFGLVGMEDVQQAFLTCLEEILVDHPGLIDEKTIAHWMDESCVKSKLVHSITPGYVAALLGSQSMLASLCRQYFAKYDVNQDGRMDVSEISALAAELHSNLGLPSDAVDESWMQGPVAAEEFPEWFARVLRHTLEKSEKVKVEPIVVEKVEEEIEQLRPEYLTALLASPRLLDSICSRLFTTYDSDKNGLLEPGEALRLSTELHRGLGLPPAISTEDQLLASMTKFTRGRNQTALVASEFPGWFQHALKGIADERRSKTI